MSKLAVVTGAGSGVGRATALALANEGWRVHVFGRRAGALKETRDLAAENSGRITCHVCDIGDGKAVADAASAILSAGEPVQVLVNAAGTNAPKRALAVLSDEDYHAMMDTNLNGAYYCVQAFLPGMRANKCGTIVNVISDAGKQASPKAGPAYVMSKFGLAGLTQAINAEERPNGVRAVGIFPGDIDTPLLDRRPVVPDAAARSRMMRPEDIAACIMLAINLPPRAVIEELLIRPG